MRILARLRARLTYANVVSSLALFLVVTGGTALAAHETIFSDDIVDGEVQNQDLGADSVSSAKIQTQAVTTGDLAPNSVTDTRIPTAAVGSSEIKQGDVFNADLAANSITDTRIAEDAVGRSELKPDSVGASELGFESVAGADVINDSLNHADIGDIRRTAFGINDDDDDGVATQQVWDETGAVGAHVTVTAYCDTDEPNQTAFMTIKGDTGGWAMDSNAPNGLSDEDDIPINTEKLLIQVGPAPDRHIHTGDFSAMVGATRVHGLVSARIFPNSNLCNFWYTRFGQ